MMSFVARALGTSTSILPAWLGTVLETRVTPNPRRTRTSSISASSISAPRSFRTRSQRKRIVREKRREQSDGDIDERFILVEIVRSEMRQRLRHVKSAIRCEAGDDRIAERGGSGFSARADEFHGSRLAAGPLIGETKLSLSMPALENAARIECDAATAAGCVSNHAKMLGPAPERVGQAAYSARRLSRLPESLRTSRT